MRIAVLDDNVALSEMLQHVLELAGHTVVVYNNPSKFLAKIIEPTTASIPFDLLIVDLLLEEGMSGVEVIHRAGNSFPALPVILISTGSSWQIEAARRALPSVKVLRKPFSLSTLLAMVKELS